MSTPPSGSRPRSSPIRHLLVLNALLAVEPLHCTARHRRTFSGFRTPNCDAPHPKRQNFFDDRRVLAARPRHGQMQRSVFPSLPASRARPSNVGDWQNPCPDVASAKSLTQSKRKSGPRRFAELDGVQGAARRTPNDSRHSKHLMRGSNGQRDVFLPSCATAGTLAKHVETNPSFLLGDGKGD